MVLQIAVYLALVHLATSACAIFSNIYIIMSRMGKELDDLAKRDKSCGFNCGMKYLHRAMVNGVHFPPRRPFQIEKADKSPLRKVISNYPGFFILGLDFVMHLRQPILVLSLCLSMIAHHHKLLASSRAGQGIQVSC